MDFSNSGQPVNSNGSGMPETRVNRTGSANGGNSNRINKDDWSKNKVFRMVQVLLSACVLVVVIGLLVFLAVNDNNVKSENNYIQNSKLQAVFLNTGQVYFGNISSLNNSYLVLTNIFYLQTNSTNGTSSASSTSTNGSSSNTTVSLVKLGCEIHAPLDQMVINKTSVTFWENLSPDGQVAKAVATWEKENPNGQKCSDQSTAGTSGQSTPQGSSGTTGTTSTGTTSSTGSSTAK